MATDRLIASGIEAPDWALPAGVRALYTTREGGISAPPRDGFNLGTLCGDAPEAVAVNRARLRLQGGLPSEPGWLHQVHGTRVMQLPLAESMPRADAAVAREAGEVCVVMMADCLPVLFCDDAGAVVAAAHAGWRGLAAGVLESTIDAMAVAPTRLRAWLGPCIGPTAFEVGPEVVEAFASVQPDDADCFSAGEGDRHFADLAELARRRLRRAGLEAIAGGGECTHSQPSRWFSHRRDGTSGRMAAMIWREHA